MNPRSHVNPRDYNAEYDRALLDTDGGVRLALNKSRGRRFSPNIGVSAIFDVTQARPNAAVCTRLKARYGGRVHPRRDAKHDEFIYRLYFTSPGGRVWYDTLNRNLPLDPSRRRDFLIASHLVRMNARRRNDGVAVRQIYRIELVYGTSNEVRPTGGARKRVSKSTWYGHVRPTASQVRRGQKWARIYFRRLDAAIAYHRTVLPHVRLSPGYVAGAHVGDGTLVMILNWRPDRPYSSRPCWAISNEDPAYLCAFRTTVGCGTIKVAGKNCYQYVTQSIGVALRYVLPTLSRAPMPRDRAKQYDRWARGVIMLATHCVYSPVSLARFVATVYRMSSRSRRKYSQRQLYIWGLKRLRRVRRPRPQRSRAARYGQLYLRSRRRRRRPTTINTDEASLSKGKQPRPSAKAPK